MKKHILLFTFLALIFQCGNGFAQKITLGLKGGFSIPNLTGGSSDTPLNTGYSSRFATDGGVFGEYHVNKKFSVSIGLEYSSQGGLKHKFQAFQTPQEMISQFPGTAPEYLYANFKSEAKINYLLIPVLARYTWKISKNSPVKVYAALGPFAGYLLNAHQVTSGTSKVSMLNQDNSFTELPFPPLDFNANTNIKNDLYKFNAGIDGFVGISVNVTKQDAFFIEGGGNYGFLAIQKGTGNGKNNTGAGVITFGYTYTLQNKYYRQGHR